MDVKHSFWRAIATAVIWVMVTGGFAIVSAIMGAQLGDDIIGVLFLQLAAAVICTGFVWDWGRIPGDQRRKQADRHDTLFDDSYGFDEKPKRDRLANALRTLSDDELLRLKTRIRSGEVDETILEQTLIDEENSRSR